MSTAIAPKAVYLPKHPERTALDRLFEEHFEPYTRMYEQRFEPRDR